MDVYQRPYNPLYPVVCLDETSRQLIEETRVPIAVKPGEPKKVDYEYRRNGVVDLFMIFEPLAGQRHVMITDSRKRTDFANCIEMIEDEYYPNCEKIVLVMDNLNTHNIASLYATFPPQHARELAERLGIITLRSTEAGLILRKSNFPLLVANALQTKEYPICQLSEICFPCGLLQEITLRRA